MITSKVQDWVNALEVILRLQEENAELKKIVESNTLLFSDAKLILEGSHSLVSLSATTHAISLATDLLAQFSNPGDWIRLDGEFLYTRVGVMPPYIQATAVLTKIAKLHPILLANDLNEHRGR